MRSSLLPVSWVFGGVVALRNAAFDTGFLRSRAVGIPVISVGNLSVGGTGKTPLTEEIAHMLIRNGYRTGVLSRGYGRDTSGFRWVRRGSAIDRDAAQCGDEPVQMAVNLDRAFIAVDEDRVQGALRMIEEERIQVLVLDDAFQHRWIARSFDIVVMTVNEVLAGDVLLPAGRMREPVASLGRAHALVVTGCTEDAACGEAREILQRTADLDVYYTSSVLTGLRDLNTGNSIGVEELAGKGVLAVSAIGNPSSFEESLKKAGLTVAARRHFPDHHPISGEDMAALSLVCKQKACDAVVMTQKDAVRTDGTSMQRFMAGRPVYYASMRLEWMGGSGGLERSVLARVKRKMS